MSSFPACRAPLLWRSRQTLRRFAPVATRWLLPVLLVILVSAALLPNAGCSNKAGTSTSATATRQLQQYRHLLAISDAVEAAALGKQIVQKYPGSAAAMEVGKSLPQIAARAHVQTRQRLANLWNYTAANAGGLEHTAGIYASAPAGSDVQLILRRHVNWGQSIYLFSAGNGFACKKLCDVVMHFDGKREVWQVYPPTSGEPAIFVKDDQAFLAALEQAKVITMDVAAKNGGSETLKFEVAGFDPAKFPPLPKS